MAKAKSRISGFFDQKRRECRLQDFRVLKTRGGERRLKLSIDMPLTNRPVTGMPGEFVDAFELMAREDSPVATAKIPVMMEGGRVSIYPTDDHPLISASGHGATLQDFSMGGSGNGESRKVELSFSLYIPFSPDLDGWCCDHLHSDFWMEIAATQLSLDSAETDEDSEDDTDEEDPEEEGDD